MRCNSKEHSRLLIFLCMFLTLLRLCNVQKIYGGGLSPPPKSTWNFNKGAQPPWAPLHYTTACDNSCDSPLSFQVLLTLFIFTGIPTAERLAQAGAHCPPPPPPPPPLYKALNCIVRSRCWSGVSLSTRFILTTASFVNRQIAALANHTYVGG
jgi:hypothetical protein